MESERWRQVEHLFNAALERPPETRHAFLKGACGENAELINDVESLLAHEERVAGFLETRAGQDGRTLDTVALIGRQIGPYRIVSLLGAGGMGDVYRAHDSKLGRDVAIKTLPVGLARVPNRLVHLRREARTLASLNHPHIAAIYGLEESADVDCMVLELVEGEALRGPLPMATALDRARQVAEALEAAHEKGIIHRDLKPANVKVTPQGRVKVLDFGLAKAIWGTEGDPDLTYTATSTGVANTVEHIVGTPGYMSPEQSRGGDVDQRTDIWSFGCLFYELLTGKRAFVGETELETIAAVLEREPNWSALPAKTPSRIRELLRQCLQKDAKRRLLNIADAGRTIDEAQHTWDRSKAVAAAAVGLTLLAVCSALWFRGPARPPGRSDWVQLTNFPDPVSQPALSPDGRMLAFVRSPSTFFAVGQVYVKSLPDGEPVQLTHDNLAKTNPTFSRDGTRIAYTTVDSRFNWDTSIVPVRGGEPRGWLRNASDLVWTASRQVLFSERPRKGIVAAGNGGAERHDVYIPPTERGIAHRPQASPDGKWVLLTELSGYGDWLPCRVVPMDGSSPGRQVGPPDAGCTFGAWSPDGKWIYLTSKAGGRYHIWRQRFPDGRPEQFTSGLTEEEGIAMAPDGRSFVTAVALQSTSIWLHDARGEHQISRLEGNAAYARFTPDGKKVCYRVVKEVPRFGTARDPGELWVADLESGQSEPLAPGFQPFDYDISADGKQVVIEVVDNAGKPRLWVAPIDRRSPPQPIPNVEGRQAMFGPGGEILFRHMEGPSGFVYRVRPDGTGLLKSYEKPVLAVTGVSPDGRSIEVWAPLPGDGPPVVQVLPLGGGPPVIIGSNTWLQWSRNAHALWIQGGPVAYGRTYIVPLPRGKALPPIPSGGFHSEDEVARLPGARRIEVTGAPGPSPDVYAFDQRTIQRNLYRIPIP